MLYKRRILEQSLKLKSILSKDDWDTLYKDNHNSIAFNVLCMVLSEKAKESRKFYKVLNKHVFLAEGNFTTLPLAIFNKKTNKVIVYDNIMIKVNSNFLGKLTKLEEASPFVASGYVHRILSTVVNSEQKRKLVKKGLKAKKFFSNKKEISIVRFLNQYTDKEYKLSEKHAKAVEFDIIAELTPAKLIIADSPEKWMEMYSSTGPSSCMVLGQRYDRDWKWMLDNKVHKHPVLFYYYHPDLVGVYYKSNGKVMARAILFSSEDGRLEVGRMYGHDSKCREKLYECIKDTFKDKKVSINKQQWIGSSFTIPGEYCDIKQDYIMPFPYTDNIYPYWKVGFDIERKEFILVNKTKKKIKEIEKYREIKSTLNIGYICAKDIILKKQCIVCGKGMNSPSDSHVTAQDGTEFCSSSCAINFGYKDIYTSTGTIWERAEKADTESVIVWSNTTQYNWFSNKEAALRNGYVPYKFSIEDKQIRLGGLYSGGDKSFVKYKNEIFAVPSIIIRAIASERYNKYQIVSQKQDVEITPYVNASILYCLEDNLNFVEGGNNGPEIDW